MSLSSSSSSLFGGLSAGTDQDSDHRSGLKDENEQSDGPANPRKRVKKYPEPIHRTRAKKPKTRSGCKTCKTRRVKCGEERPSCFRCVKLGVCCDGYEKPLPSKNRVKLEIIKPLMPRAVANDPLCILPSIASFNNSTEYQYFLHFRDEVCLDLAGPLHVNIWNYIILQSTNQTPALRNLTISIAALSKSQSCPDSSSSHSSFALRQYGKALNDLHQVIYQNDDHAVRTSLIASLLIFCFENIHGNHESAVSQLRSALIMMRKRLFTIRKPYSRLRPISSVPGLEVDILDTFVRLDCTIMSRVASDGARASSLEMDYIAEDFTMPKAFTTVLEAKNYLEHIQYKSMPYMAALSDILMYGDQYNAFPPREAYDEIILHLRLWIRAFKPLLDAAKRKRGLDFIATATQQVLTLATAISTQRIFLGAAGTTNPTLFVRESKEIVSLTRRIVANECFKKGFVVDCGIVPPLFVLITLCRDRDLREDAIQVLEDCGERMEVTWNAAAVARIGRGILDAENSRMSEMASMS